MHRPSEALDLLTMIINRQPPGAQSGISFIAADKEGTQDDKLEAHSRISGPELHAEVLRDELVPRRNLEMNHFQNS